jgi:hypothetical protein
VSVRRMGRHVSAACIVRDLALGDRPLMLLIRPSTISQEHDGINPDHEIEGLSTSCNGNYSMRLLVD